MVNGNQPVKVDDLKTALQSLSEEVLWTGFVDMQLEQGIWLPVGDCASIKVQYADMNGNKRNILKEVILPVELSASYSGDNIELHLYSVKDGMAMLDVSSRYRSSYYAVRVLGVRTGGAALS